MARRIPLILICCILTIVSFAFPAFAQVLQCDNFGRVISGTELLNTQPTANAGTASFCSEAAPSSAEGRNPRIFSRVICTYVETLNQVMGRVYCGMQYQLQKYVAIAIIIYLAIFGLQILSGVTQLTTKEVLVRLIKIGLVWMFVSNYDYGVNLLFMFFVDFANQSIWWTMGAITTSAADPTVANNINLGSYSQTSPGVVPVYMYFDVLIYDILNNNIIAENQELIIFFMLIGLIFWPILMIAAYWFFTTFMILIRALLSFLLSITATAFLVAISPIFFCLLLFKSTQQFFETWLKFLISFAMQVMIVFAVVAMWLLIMLQFIGFFGQLASVIFPDNSLSRTGAMTTRVESIGVCPYVVETVSRPTIRAPLYGLNIRCADPTFTTTEIITTGPDKGELTQRSIANLNRLIKISNVAPPHEHNQDCRLDPNCEYGNEIANPAGGVTATQHKLQPLIFYLFYHLMILSLVAYTFDAILRQAPMIARQLAGPQYVPKLGQGFGGLGLSSKLPGISRTRDGSRSVTSSIGSAVTNILTKNREMPTTRTSPGAP